MGTACNESERDLGRSSKPAAPLREELPADDGLELSWGDVVTVEVYSFFWACVRVAVEG